MNISAKWRERFARFAAACFGGFSAGFLCGGLIAAADPDGGWAAWRVALTTATAVMLAIFVIGLIALFVEWVWDA